MNRKGSFNFCIDHTQKSKTVVELYYVWEGDKDFGGGIVYHIIVLKGFVQQGYHFIFQKVYILGGFTYSKHVR